MIKATCSECQRNVDLTIDDVHVYLLELGGEGTYAFFCPVCGEAVQKPAQACTLKALTQIGVMYSLIVENPITETEVLNFHEMLQDDEAIKYFLGEVN